MANKDYSSNTINTDVTNFNMNLSSADADTQKALDTLNKNAWRKENIWHAYGGYENQNLTLPCDADTWTKVTNTAGTLWVGSEANGITMDDDEMVIANAGDYVGQVSLTISALNGKDFHFRVYNMMQSAATIALGISTTGAGNEMCLSMPLYLETDAGDRFQMQINSTDGTDPVLDDAVFYVAYLHD